MSNNNYVDYANIFCDSVDTIIKKRLEGISFDKTELYTVIDTSKKNEGIYQVGNDLITFDAYSPLAVSYNKGDSVYVKIPKGDWNEQKLITGKKVDRNATTPINYDSPFDYYLDITSNLAENTSNKTFGLVANHPEEQSVEIFHWKETTPLVGYTRLGLQGSFQSWLDAYKAVSGDYGLRVVITAEEDSPQVADSTVEVQDKAKTVNYELFLNVEDFYGNPYNFETFFQQEKVFDISEINKIVEISIYFYQAKGTFKTKEGKQIPYKNEISIIDSYLPPNLFIKDLYIGFGNDVSEFQQEGVLIYTLDSKLYTPTPKQDKDNYKKIQLRWIHYDEIVQRYRVINLKQYDYEVAENDLFDCEIRWYRYSLGARSADEYCGPHWRSLSIETYKDGCNAGNVEINDPDWKLKYKTSPYYPKTLLCWLFPDVTIQSEQVKAVLLYNGQVIRSNILVFENKDEVVSKPTIDAMQALELYCEDESNGNYLIYTPGNTLLESAEASKERQLTATFKLSTDPVRGPIEIAEEIKWYFPNKNTMLVFSENNNQLKGCKQSVEGDYNVYTCTGQGDTGNILVNNNKDYCYNYINYRIKSYYSAFNSNNTIKCEVTKSKTKYTYIKEFTFGQAGTTGTDYTFVLDILGGKTGISLTNQTMQVIAQLYDYNNKLVDIDGKTLKWEILNNNNCLEVRTGETNKETQKEIALLVNSFDNIQAPILKVTLTDFGDYELVAYLGIPIKCNDDFKYILGATTIWYDSMGSPTYYRNPYQIYNKEGLVDKDVTWEVKNFTDKEDAYSHTLDKNYRLRALNFYIEDACQNIAIIAKNSNNEILWQQAIVSTQNKYPSSTLNKWDGSLKIDEKENYILSAQIAAGRKNNDNSFSGVMLGAWDQQKNEGVITRTTGLYGFDYGEMTYAFKDDGTAFIGKSGKGRISFDGNEGIIESGSYTLNEGMSINLTEGTINAHQFTLNAGGTQNANGTTNWVILTTDIKSNPLSIGGNFWVEWDGTLHATNGKFSGDITGSSISGGTIKGATIAGGSIRVPETGDALFEVASDGSLTATRADITGIITSTEGAIGGWTIGETTLTSNDGKVYLDSAKGTIHGAIVEAGTLSSNSTKNNLITLDGYLKVGNFGKLGYFESNMDNTKRPGIGMDYGNGISAVKATEANAGMSYNVTNYISVEDSLVKVGANDKISLTLKNGKNQWSISQNSGIHLSVPDSGTIYMHGGTLDCSGIDDFIGVYARFK